MPFPFTKCRIEGLAAVSIHHYFVALIEALKSWTLAGFEVRLMAKSLTLADLAWAAHPTYR